MSRKAAVIAFLGLLSPPREVGNLVLDGIPDVPKRIVDRQRQYLSTRAVQFLDWEPSGNGMLIATRFGETSQLHYVLWPGMSREQWTFEGEPVSYGSFDPAQSWAVGGGRVLFQMDAGGAENSQFYWLNRATGRDELLTDGKSRNESPLWSNAGGSFAFASTQRNGVDFDIYLMRRGKPRRVLETKGHWTPRDFSADDARLLVEHEISVSESTLHVLDIASGKLDQINRSDKKIAYGAAAFARSGNVVYYTSDEDSEFKRLVAHDLKTGKKEILTPNIDWDVEQLAVSRDGKWLAFAVDQDGAGALYMQETAQGAKPQRIDLPVGVVSGLKFDRGSRRLGFTVNAVTGSDVRALDVGKTKPLRWAFYETGGLLASTFVTPKLVRYPTFDGKQIPAWYYRPKSAKGRLPVIIDIHDDPEGQSRPLFNPSAQYFVNEIGAAVLQPNVRGSMGYGKTYVTLDNAEKREDSVKDIGALIDWIATRPELDKTRVAVIGGSYGGHMVLASLVHYSDRLRCGVDIAGISNFVTFLKSTKDYRVDFQRVEYGDERDPKVRAILERISPVTNAAKIKVPLFVAQGKNDPVVPVTEAEQIVKTVRQGGGPVWYMTAKDEGHGFQKKTNRDAFFGATALFFETFLKK